MRLRISVKPPKSKIGNAIIAPIYVVGGLWGAYEMAPFVFSSSPDWFSKIMSVVSVGAILIAGVVFFHRAIR